MDAGRWETWTTGRSAAQKSWEDLNCAVAPAPRWGRRTLARTRTCYSRARILEPNDTGNVLLTLQAEAKSAPVNPMKELRIEKLVISAYHCGNYTSKLIY
jgi:hypothetical protein